MNAARGEMMLFSLASRRQALRPSVAKTQVPSPRRPRIGLALGGGAARGWAHIGVLHELIENGIAPDVVAGTSIGAVVGACHAAGKLDSLESFACGLNRRRMLRLMDLSFAGSGLVAGARLKRRLDHDLQGARIENLAVPFAAVATELGTGREVCLSRGDLVESVRASYALPGIFQPVQMDGRWLFDGAMSNPVPVSVARALGADFVIAVNLTADLSGPVADVEADTTKDASVAVLDDLATSASVDGAEPMLPEKTGRLSFIRRRIFKRSIGSAPVIAPEVPLADSAPGIASVVVGAFSIAQERISRSRLAIDPPDVMINARLTTVGIFDFHRADDLIAHGRQAARRALPSIEAQMNAVARRRVEF